MRGWLKSNIPSVSGCSIELSLKMFPMFKYVLLKLLLISYFINETFTLSPKDSEFTCPKFNVMQGKMRTKLRGRLAKAACLRGYLLIGDRQLVCFKGNWIGTKPACIKRGCPSITSIVSDGNVKESYEGAFSEITCNDNFELSGPSVLACDGRMWNGTTPACYVKKEMTYNLCSLDDDDKLCGWTNKNMIWRRYSGATPSNFADTGPQYDHTLGNGNNGSYLYMEASTLLEGNTAELISPNYLVNRNMSCFSFWYHMNGAHIGDLNVYFGKKLVFNRSGNHGNRWLNAIIPIKPQPSPFKIKIEAVRGIDFIGDIAIDDYKLVEGKECLTEELPTNVKFDGVTPNYIDSIEVPSNSCDCSEDCKIKNNCCTNFLEICGTANYPTNGTKQTINYQDTSVVSTTFRSLTDSIISSNKTNFENSYTTNLPNDINKINLSSLENNLSNKVKSSFSTDSKLTISNVTTTEQTDNRLITRQITESTNFNKIINYNVSEDQNIITRDDKIDQINYTTTYSTPKSISVKSKPVVVDEVSQFDGLTVTEEIVLKQNNGLNITNTSDTSSTFNKTNFKDPNATINSDNVSVDLTMKYFTTQNVDFSNSSTTASSDNRSKDTISTEKNIFNYKYLNDDEIVIINSSTSLGSKTTKEQVFTTTSRNLPITTKTATVTNLPIDKTTILPTTTTITTIGIIYNKSITMTNGPITRNTTTTIAATTLPIFNSTTINVPINTKTTVLVPSTIQSTATTNSTTQKTTSNIPINIFTNTIPIIRSTIVLPITKTTAYLSITKVSNDIPIIKTSPVILTTKIPVFPVTISSTYQNFTRNRWFLPRWYIPRLLYSTPSTLRIPFTLRNTTILPVSKTPANAISSTSTPSSYPITNRNGWGLQFNKTQYLKYFTIPTSKIPQTQTTIAPTIKTSNTMATAKTTVSSVTSATYQNNKPVFMFPTQYKPTKFKYVTETFSTITSLTTEENYSNNKPTGAKKKMKQLYADFWKNNVNQLEYTRKWKPKFNFKGNQALSKSETNKLYKEKSNKIMFSTLSGIALTLLTLMAIISLVVFFIRKRRINRDSIDENATDMQYLAADEVLNFNMARPSPEPFEDETEIQNPKRTQRGVPADCIRLMDY